MSQNPAKRYAIFLNGEYPPKENSFYFNLVKEVDCSIAVDGGIALFERLGASPDIILADFDSSPKPELDSKIEIVALDSDKDKTDGQLALELVLERGAVEIAICGYRGGPATDQILGNLLLLQMASDLKPATRVYCESRYEKVWFIKDNSIELQGEKDENLSIVPLDEEILLSVMGVRYAVDELRIKRGDTRSLSNTFQAPVCRVAVSGSALVFQRQKLHRKTEI